jgi:hypothetical protein
MPLKIFYLFLLFNFCILPQTLLDVPKFRIYPGPLTQTEPVAALNPGNSSLIFVSAVTVNISGGFKSEGVYVSTDGGLNWTGNDTCRGASIINHGGDPGVAVTDNNRLILSHIGYLYPGMYSNYSDDLTETWSSNNEITSNQSEDKGTLGIDLAGASAFHGRLYLTWVDIVNSPRTVRCSFSTDEGVNWSVPMQVNPNPPTNSTGTSITTGPDGKIYICWAGYTPTNPFHEDYIGFGTSTDGGVSWNINQNIIDMNGIAGLLSAKSNIKVNGLPQIEIDNSGGSRNGWLYIITTEINNSPAGSDPDIILHRSTDAGNSWSPGIRVNQDPVNNGKIQYFPHLTIDDMGTLNILFYDDRNTTSDSAMIFIARSTDGGDGWKEYEITNTTFKPKPITGGVSGYQGDHIALIANNNNLNAFWMADYSGIYQVWSSIIDRTVLGVKQDNVNKPAAFELFQNYPNPFNPSTLIKYSINQPSYVTLKVFDALGREVKTLASNYQNAGIYEVNFKTDNLSSGIYFYTLQSGNSRITKKMLLLR